MLNLPIVDDGGENPGESAICKVVGLCFGLSGGVLIPIPYLWSRCISSGLLHCVNCIGKWEIWGESSFFIGKFGVQAPIKFLVGPLESVGESE